MKNTMILAAAMGAVGVVLADTITVAQGETQNITAAATVTAMEVHGTLNLQGTASAAAELTFDPKTTKAYLGSAAGEVRLVNFPADTPLVNYELPLVFTDSADMRNVRGWTLYVDGVATTKKLSYLNGRLVCLTQGTVLLFR